jgi:1-acyl-sn-glycerol-3-phosphate acyltransferase
MLIRTSLRVATAGAHVIGVAGSRRQADDPYARVAALSRLMANVCAAHGIELAVRGEPPRAPAILIANHLSYIDPVVIGGLTPCVPISKGEVARWPLIGAVGATLGVLFVERADAMSGARVLRGAERLLRAGISVLNFPEGTTSRGDTVLPFRRGIFGLAQRAGVPVIPIGLRMTPRELAWTGDDYFLPHYLKTASRGVNLVEVRFGGPVPAYRSMAADDFAELCRDCLVRVLA